MLRVLSIGPGADNAVRDEELAFRPSSAAVQNENLTLTDHERIVGHNKSVS